MINRVTLIGNLGSDPEVKELSTGTKLARIGLATNDRYLDKTTNEWKDQTEWHNVIFWRNLAESAERSLKKGMQIYVEGKIKYRKWQDEHGVDKYATDIEAKTYRIMGKRENSNTQNRLYPSQEPAQVATPHTNMVQEPNAPAASNPSINEDDLPF